MVNIFYLDYDPQKCASYYCDKHVNKILIEILQILSQVHHIIGTRDPPYKKCLAIKPGLAPFQWAMASKSNYQYCADLAYYLFLEYQYRFQKSEHKCQPAIQWLRDHIPEAITKKNRTRYQLTESVKVYHQYFDTIEACRYAYVDFKCKYDKWTRRGRPAWFFDYEHQSTTYKFQLRQQIMDNVRHTLPLNSRQLGLYPREFHCFLRICYDNLFEAKWDHKLKNYPNMFNLKKPLIDQLGLGHLLKVLELSNSLMDPETLDQLNQISLKYRKNKLPPLDQLTIQEQEY